MLNICCWKIKALTSYFWRSCTDQRSQNKLIWSMKGVESLRIQSFSRRAFGNPKNPVIRFFWIPGSGFWKNPGIPGYPGIAQGPAHGSFKVSCEYKSSSFIIPFNWYQGILAALNTLLPISLLQLSFSVFLNLVPVGAIQVISWQCPSQTRAIILHRPLIELGRLRGFKAAGHWHVEFMKRDSLLDG